MNTKYIKRTESILFFVLIFSLLLACSSTYRDDLTTPAINNTNTHQDPDVLPTSAEIIHPTLTQRPSPEPKCPGLDTSLTMHEAKTGKEAEQIIFEYLNKGGLPEQLQYQISNLGQIVDSYQEIKIDVNMDGIQEIVIAINFAPPKGGGLEDAYSNLSIYSCANGSYQIKKIAGEGMQTIKIISVENLLDTEQPELLVAKDLIFFRSGGCYEFVEMYSLKPRGWFSSLKTDEFLCDINTELKSIDAGGKELIIEGRRGCSYMACGPSRDRRLVYKFLNDKVEITTDELLPSQYRIHALEDGEIAIEQRDLETAIKVYDMAANDTSLINWLTELEKELQVSQNMSDAKIQKIAFDYQTSFALFREFVLLLYLDRDDEAVKVMSQIQKHYPEGHDGNQFVDLSTYLLESIKKGMTVKEACELTNEYLADKYILGGNDFVYLHLNGWGDMSPQIGELLCPVVE